MAIGYYRILGIYRKRDGKWLLDSMGIWDGKFVWDIMSIGEYMILGYLQEKIW